VTAEISKLQLYEARPFQSFLTYDGTTCIYPKCQVDYAVDNAAILYGKDLRKQRSEFLSVLYSDG